MTTNWDWLVQYADELENTYKVEPLDDMLLFKLALQIQQDEGFHKEMAERLSIDSESDSDNDMTFVHTSKQHAALLKRFYFQTLASVFAWEGSVALPR